MLLVHDLGEINAGDKFVFEGWDERKAEELRSLERICGMAPKKTGDLLLGLWKEFDAGESAAAFDVGMRGKGLFSACAHYQIKRKKSLGQLAVDMRYDGSDPA